MCLYKENLEYYKLKGKVLIKNNLDFNGAQIVWQSNIGIQNSIEKR